MASKIVMGMKMINALKLAGDSALTCPIPFHGACNFICYKVPIPDFTL